MSKTLNDTPAVGTAVSGCPEAEPGKWGSAGASSAIHVRVANGPLVGPALRRVVSIVLARADWPLDGLDDALLVCDALCVHAPAHARGDRVTVSVQANEREAELRVLELTGDGAAQLVRDTMLPVVGNVLERIADSVSVEPQEDGGSQLVLLLSSG